MTSSLKGEGQVLDFASMQVKWQILPSPFLELRKGVVAKENGLINEIETQDQTHKFML